MTDEIQEKFPHLIQVDDLEASAIKGLYAKDRTQYLKITKLTLQKFLEACLRPGGQFYPYMSQTCSFMIDYHINESLPRNSEDRHLQIARYFEGMAEAPPQIFIQDGGYTYTPASLGSLTEGFNTRDKNGTQVTRIMDVVPIPIEIVCASLDEQQIEDMIAFVSAAFGQDQRYTCNYVLRPPWDQSGVYWEVRVPLQHTPGPKSHSTFKGDPRDQLWQASISMTVEFENSSYRKYLADPRYQGVRAWNMELTAPNKVRIGSKVMFSIRDMPYPVRVYSDNSKIAIVRSMQTQYMITPKRLGTFKIIVTKRTAEAPGAVIGEKEVEVVSG